jgi:DegV family protein with EDD domain
MVSVVTDSTALLPVQLVEQYGIGVVPLQVTKGERVTTSQPTAAAFAAAYAACAGDEVVAVHLSGELSGTVRGAEVAGRTSGRTVRVVDSRQTGMGLGFVVLAAAEAAVSGVSLSEVVSVAESAVGRTDTFFYVDTLEHLRRGGRIGAAAALVGTALSVKPLLHIVEGSIAPLEKVRTASRAIARLEEIAVEAAGSSRVRVAVHHLASADRADALASRLKERLDPDLLVVSEIGDVVGAHVGPGMLAVVVHRLP